MIACKGNLHLTERKMKKIVLVTALIAMVAFGAFAEVKDTLALSSKIKELDKATYTLAAKTTGLSGSYAGDDISDLTLTADGMVYFQILNSSVYNKQAARTVTVTVSQNEHGFVLQNGSGSDISDDPSAEEYVSSSLVDFLGADGSTPTANSWTVTYSKGILVDHSETPEVVGYFAVSWTGVPALGAGTYKNTISLNIATV
jgi:hypothetical protein